MLTSVEAGLLQRCEERACETLSFLLETMPPADPFSWALLYLAVARGDIRYQGMSDLDRHARELVERVLSQRQISRFANHDLSGALLALYVAKIVRKSRVDCPQFSDVEEGLRPHFSDRTALFFDDPTLSLSVCLGLSAYPERSHWVDLKAVMLRFCPDTLDPLQFFLWSEAAAHIPDLPHRPIKGDFALRGLAILAAGDLNGAPQPVAAVIDALRAGLELLSAKRPPATDIALFVTGFGRARKLLEQSSRQELVAHWTKGALIARLAAVGVTLVAALLVGLWSWAAWMLGVFDADNLSLRERMPLAAVRLGFLYGSIWVALGLAGVLITVWRVLGMRGLASDALLLSEGRTAMGRLLNLGPVLGTVLLEGILVLLFQALSQ